MLYGGSVDRKVYAISVASGDVQWSSRMPGMLVGGVLLAGDTIFAASARPEGRVSALRRDTGKQIWRANTPPIGAPLALIDGHLIALSEQGEVLGLDPSAGHVRWRRHLGVARAGPVSAGPGAFLVATTDSLFRLATATGQVERGAPSPGFVVSPWLVRNGVLVGGTADSQVVSVNPTDLALNWSFKVDAPVLSSPAALGDTVFVATRIGTIYRIDPGPQPRIRPIVTLEWPITSPVSIVDRRIVLGGADGVIRALRLDGHEVWRVRVWHPVELSPVVLTDGLIAVGGNGDLHRYRQ
jgi:outer membrane protein assembly factor BamB